MEMGEDGRQEDQVWELLADLWTELTVYMAPSGGELHVKAHKEAGRCAVRDKRWWFV
jgi:hypothetical protein